MASKTIAAHPEGAFSWSELATSDPKAAARFYAALFGWDVQVRRPNPAPLAFDRARAATRTRGAAGERRAPSRKPPADRRNLSGGGSAGGRRPARLRDSGSEDVGAAAGPADYTLFTLDGDDVAASYLMGSDEGPPHWNCHVSVVSADEAAARARSLGGSVVGKGPFDVADIGRMAILRDPPGATFMVWQPKSHIGARRLNEPGALCWTELATTDTAASEKFYTSLFGWTAKKGTQPPGEYTEFLNRGEAIAGMLGIQPGWSDVPPHWMPYFAVVDCDAAAAIAKLHGGKLEVPPTDIRGVGRFAVVRDPQGAVFAIIALRQAA